MSGRGNCYDNSISETFFKTIEAELIWCRSQQTRRDAELAVFESSTSMAYTICAGGTQHWAGKTGGFRAKGG